MWKDSLFWDWFISFSFNVLFAGESHMYFVGEEATQIDADITQVGLFSLLISYVARLVKQSSTHVSLNLNNCRNI